MTTEARARMIARVQGKRPAIRNRPECALPKQRQGRERADRSECERRRYQGCSETQRTASALAVWPSHFIGCVAGL